jgi:hypothetical protein
MRSMAVSDGWNKAHFFSTSSVSLGVTNATENNTAWRTSGVANCPSIPQAASSGTWHGPPSSGW